MEFEHSEKVGKLQERGYSVRAMVHTGPGAAEFRDSANLTRRDFTLFTI